MVKTAIGDEKQKQDDLNVRNHTRQKIYFTVTV